MCKLGVKKTVHVIARKQLYGNDFFSRLTIAPIKSKGHCNEYCNWIIGYIARRIRVYEASLWNGDTRRTLIGWNYTRYSFVEVYGPINHLLTVHLLKVRETHYRQLVEDDDTSMRIYCSSRIMADYLESPILEELPKNQCLYRNA